MEKNKIEKKISAIIPSNNNYKIINTIKSIRSFVDEIIIVNSAKDDEEGKELLKNFEFPFQGN